MDERRQLDYSASERFLYRPAFDVRKIGLCKDKDVQVVDRPKNAVFKPIKWNGTV